MGDRFHPPTKAHIDVYIWCAIGAAFGWLAGTVKGNATRTTRIEDVLVGVFGAFIGAEFVSGMLHAKGTPDFGFGARFGLAIAGACVVLGLLMMMRRSVGPLKSGKKRAERDY